MMNRSLLLIMCSFCFVLVLISNSVNAMYLTTTPSSPSSIDGVIGESFSIDVFMSAEDGVDSFGLMGFKMRAQWTNDTIDEVSFTSSYDSDSIWFNDTNAYNPMMHEVQWKFDYPGIGVPTAKLGTFHFIGNEIGTTTFTINLGGGYNVLDIDAVEGDENDIVSNVTDQVTTINILEDNTGNPGSPVPEPTTMLLFATGLLGLAGVNRKK